MSMVQQDPDKAGRYPLKSLVVSMVRAPGVDDADIPPLAEAQALGRSWSHEPITAIYSSDHASELAQAIASFHPTAPPLVTTATLREKVQDLVTQLGHPGLGSPGGTQSEKRPWYTPDKLTKYQEGESFDEVNTRMATAVRCYILPWVEALRSTTTRSETSTQEFPNEKVHVVAVSHAMAISQLMQVLLNLHDADPPGRLVPWPDPSINFCFEGLAMMG